MATMSDIERVVDEGRRAIGRRDDIALRQLHQLYDDLMGRIEFEIRRLDAQILDALAREDIGAVDAWLRRQDWYRSLERSIQVELDRFTVGANRLAVSAQMDAVSLASATTNAVVDVVPGISRVNASAIERWLAAARTPGSPLVQVLSNYGDAGSLIEKAITDGIGFGRGSSNITRTIMQQIEGSMDEWKVARVVRTETMRAYRGAQADSFAVLDEEGVLDGYMWVSARDATTCGLCLAMDGQIFLTYPGHQHVNCRCVAVPYVSESILPRLGPARESGEEWLLRQPEEVQKRALGSPGRYELWTNGVPLRSMVTVDVDPQWGESIRFTPLRELKEAS